MSAAPLTAREVAERLSFREFQRICLYFDLKLREERAKAPRAMRFKHGNGSEEQTVAPVWKDAKFDVLGLERAPRCVTALCRDAAGVEVKLTWNGKVRDIR